MQGTTTLNLKAVNDRSIFSHDALHIPETRHHGLSVTLWTMAPLYCI